MANLFDQLSKNHKPLQLEPKQKAEENKKVATNLHDATFAIILNKMGIEGM